jgi:hypothetical protein
MVLLGYLFAAEWNVDNSLYIPGGKGSDVVFSVTDAQRQRDAVLMEIATYQKPD